MASLADLLHMGTGRLHNCLFALLAAALVLLVPGPARASASGCAGASSATASTQRFEKSVLCLQNAERRRHGQSRVRWNRSLDAVAARYSHAMVADHFFDHYSPSHRDHMDRIAASRYRPDGGCWTAGENLFFSAGGATPRQLVKAWMGSAVHRATMLHEGWRDFGLGVAHGSPYGGPGTTVVALFGVRRKACG